MTMRLGIVGAGGRGGSFHAACRASGEVVIQAVCDINAESLEKSRINLGARESYLDYQEMLDRCSLDAVILGTPMPLHVPQAIAALSKHIHVLSEVPAGVSITECQQLVMAAQQSRAVYMMAENYTYLKQNAIVREMSRKGLFGDIYYAEGSYIHELKSYNEMTPWRRQWQTGINGITYGTHSLGPILQWMPDDRVIAVSCVGTGHHYRDVRGDLYQNEDSCIMLGRMKKGGLIQIRVDMLSERPSAMTSYALQGTTGAYESARAHGEQDRVWLAHGSDGKHHWKQLSTFEQEHLPDYWRQHGPSAVAVGHGGGDYFEILDFLEAAAGRRENPIGIHEALDMTLPGLVSQQSIAAAGAWMDVPDSRLW
jgi:predicted dehydrogenase